MGPSSSRIVAAVWLTAASEPATAQGTDGGRLTRLARGTSMTVAWVKSPPDPKTSSPTFQSPASPFSSTIVPANSVPSSKGSAP